MTEFTITPPVTLALIRFANPLPGSKNPEPEDEVPEDEEPVPVCRRCGGLVGIFLDRGLEWQHFRGDWTTSGAQEIYDPGHPAEVSWRLPGEDPQEP